MRRHGWAGDLPADDDEAVARILAATRRCIDRAGGEVGIAEVARELGVTRQTVYRYFPSVGELLGTTAAQAAAPFLDRIEAHLAAVGPDPGEVVVEAVAFTLEQLPDEPHLGLLLRPSGTGALRQGFTHPAALGLGRTLVERFPVDWAALGYDDADLDGLVEHLLRTVLSFVVDPGTPPRTGDALRAHLRRWIAPAVVAAPALERSAVSA